ncbi:uncharacterized protein LOC105421126 [Amborella trichopoda]|uniref:uncharacterized protein LOC105421126 n=1 Tax=Amborella trichopoda TaxID=13333 RepID=UPI0005D2E229|nr:uncharacterized protein LOC105421126 [Amborella trichopoda]|eukprot:XP_011625660.1 uncharacterized protein LOC105421126 [Amborella trichopoda]
MQSKMMSGTTATWENFLVEFDKKYFPNFVQEGKEVEFIQLQQGTMSIEQCIAKFEELFWYAPHIINTEARKARKFERGLRPNIWGRVISANLKVFSPLMDLAMKIEKDCEKHQLRKEGKVRHPPSENFGRKARPPPKRDFRGKTKQGNVKTHKTFLSDVRENQRPTCSYCGMRNHSIVECYKNTRACFGCGNPDHMIKARPMMKPKNKLKTQGRVFARMEQEAKAFTLVIRGILFVCDKEARILINLGSSHAFVAPHFACHLNVEPSPLDYTL